MTDSEILKKVISSLNETPHSLSVKLGYKSPASVYHIINGVNKISSGMIDKIVTKFPNVSLQFMREGIEPVILAENNLKMQMEILNNNSNQELEFLKKIAAIPDRLDNIERILKELIEENKAKKRIKD